MEKREKMYAERLKAIYEEEIKEARTKNLDILLEYSEEQGYFHFNFVTDKESWHGQDSPSAKYTPIGFTTFKEYRKFRDFLSKNGDDFFKENIKPSFDEMLAAFKSFKDLWRE